MTNTQPQSIFTANYSPPRKISRWRIFIKSHLVKIVTTSVALSLVLIGASAWNIWSVYRLTTDQNTLTSSKVDTQLQAYSQRLLWTVIFTVISFLIVLLSWLSVLSVVRDYIRERNQAQETLFDSQAALLKSGEEIAQRSQQILGQEQVTNQDNELLQFDIGQLLDVLSAMKAGDLTIQAVVSNRPTGLVADTLNRLIEELAKVIYTALSTTQQMAQGAKYLEQLADSTAAQTQEQARSVAEVQALVQDVNALSANISEQSVAADEAVQQAQAALTHGLLEMTAMTAGIETLHQGTDQIVKRTQALTDFSTLR